MTVQRFARSDYLRFFYLTGLLQNFRFRGSNKTCLATCQTLSLLRKRESIRSYLNFC